jgi:hypothetical protein
MICAKEKNNYKNTLIKTYNNLLLNKAYLLIANILLLFVILFLAYQLLFFRQVVFYTDVNAIIGLNDKLSKIDFIGNLQKEKMRKFRLHIGTRKIIFRETINNKIIHSEEIKVAPIWKEIKPKIVNRILSKRRKYEKTE